MSLSEEAARVAPQTSVGRPSVPPHRPAARGRRLAQRLEELVSKTDGRIVFTTSFGIEDQLISHQIFSAKLPVDVVTLDTGRLFPSTYRVWQETEERYQVRIRPYYPDPEILSRMVADSGVNGFYHSKDARLACCHARKVEPLRRALAGASAWVTGLRADQSEKRSSVRAVSWDPIHRLIKVAPLFDWSRDEVAGECEALGVPLNELHSKGYPSIGCEPCTRPVEPGEPERSGRWWWERDGAGECGLHGDARARLSRTKAA